MSRLTLSLVIALTIGVPLHGCRAEVAPADAWPEAVKIRFPIDDIRPDGLLGPPDGLVSVAYEFCVPSDAGVYRELLQIDPGLLIQPAARGRIGCLASQALVIGETGQTGWRDTLEALSRLEYVEEIRECHFE